MLRAARQHLVPALPCSLEQDRMETPRGTQRAVLHCCCYWFLHRILQFCLPKERDMVSLGETNSNGVARGLLSLPEDMIYSHMNCLVGSFWASLHKQAEGIWRCHGLKILKSSHTNNLIAIWISKSCHFCVPKECMAKFLSQ